MFNLLHAQKESNMWYFGSQAALNFNSGVPVNVANSMMYTIEGCASISDSLGNLLFYTNGENVWNKNNIVMPNGDSLGGHQSATQAALIVPHPNSPGLYFLFTLQQQYTPPTTNFNFSYSKINMALNSGNGDVTQKNIVIKSPIAEKLAGVMHSNGTDVWIMVHGYGNDSLFAYLLTPVGLSQTPVVSKVGQSVNGVNSLGYMKFSPDGTKLAFACRTSNLVDLFDFDAGTGVVTNEKILTLPLPLNTFGAYGIEFSVSGNYLYASQLSATAIYQWDLTSNIDSVINSTRHAFSSLPGTSLGALQMGPDGKIYLVKSGSNVLGIINNPELPGMQANFNSAGFILNGSNDVGLPNFIASNFLTVGTNEDPINSFISTFPNPFNSEITIAFPKQNLKQGYIIIKNILSQTVFEAKLESSQQEYQLDLTFLENGIYFLDLTIDGERIVKKIVKE